MLQASQQCGEVALAPVHSAANANCSPVQASSSAEISRALNSQKQHATVHLCGAKKIVSSLSAPNAPDRSRLERFVADGFRRVYGAEIRHFMPQLMSLRDEDGKLLAVCGLRHAEDNALFLETYLNVPIEQALSQQLGALVQRKDIVEVGNLAVAHRSDIRSLLASVSLYLHGTSTQWAVFTGIPSLRNSLMRLNIPLKVLTQAALHALPEYERADWGSYYDQQPQVMAVQR